MIPLSTPAVEPAADARHLSRIAYGFVALRDVTAPHCTSAATNTQGCGRTLGSSARGTARTSGQCLVVVQNLGGRP